MKTFIDNMSKIRELYQDDVNDFILLENASNHDVLCNLLDIHNFPRMKCYNMNDSSYEELEKYFLLIYKSCEEYYIFFFRKYLVNI